MHAAQSGIIGLSAEERAIFFEVIEPTLFISNPEQFCLWARTELQRIFPHGMMECGLGRIAKEGVHVLHVLGCNFPQESLQIFRRPDGLMCNPILARWLQERQPVLFEPDYEALVNASNSAWLDNFRRFELSNLATHGQCDVNSQTASYFNFSGIPGPLSPHHAYLLKLLVPHLHVALIRIVANLPVKVRKPVPQQSNLTGREMEILGWLCVGKTNWEIAQVLRISEATVKNHVHRILLRLNVSTRTQAVTKAINLKLLRTKLALSLYAGSELLLQGQELFDLCCAAI